MSDTKNKKEVKQRNSQAKKSSKTTSKKTKISKKKNSKPETYTKIITKPRNNDAVYKNRLCILALIATLAVLLSFFLFNKTFFRNEYKIKNTSIEIPYFMFFSDDKDNVLTLKTWRNYEYVNSYFDEYLQNLDRFSFYNCADGTTLYYNEEKELAVYDIEVKRSGLLKEITIDYDIIESSKVCD